MKSLQEEIINLVIKTLIPAFIAVSLSLAVVMKRKGRVTWTSAILSYIIGLCCAFISGFVVHEYFSQGWSTLIIAIIAISGEKIGYWLVFRMRLDDLLNDAFEAIKSRLRKWMN